MSLRHILNEEPPPTNSRHSYTPSSRVPSGDTTAYPEDRPPSSRPNSPSQPYLSPRQARDMQSAGHYRLSEYETAWDPRSSEWPADESQSYPNHYPYDQEHTISPIDPPPEQLPGDSYDLTSRKKRKGGDQDSDYMPTKPRRVRVMNAARLFLLTNCRADESEKVFQEG